MWNGMRPPLLVIRSRNARSKMCIAGTGPEPEAAVGIATLAELPGKVGVLDHAAAAIDERHIAKFVLRALLGHDFDGDFSIVFGMLAQKNGLGDFHQRIVDLEVIKCFEAAVD